MWPTDLHLCKLIGSLHSAFGSLSGFVCFWSAQFTPGHQKSINHFLLAVPVFASH